MSCGRITSEVQMRLQAFSTTVVYEWFTDWMACAGVDQYRATAKIKGSTAYFQLKPCYQLASVRTNNPDTPTAHSSAYLTNNGERCFDDVNISSATNTATFIRFGVAYCLSTGSTPESTDVSLQVAYGVRGKLVGSISQQVIAPDSSIQVLPIGDWGSALEVSKAKLTYVVSGASANLYHRFAYQTAPTSVESPDSWTFAEDTDTWFSNNTERSTGEKNVSTANKMFIRFGIQYKANSGANLPAFISGSVYTRS